MRILLLPSVPYEPLWRLHAAGEHPKPTVTNELHDLGITIDSIDPDTGWKNPFGRMAPYFRALDPLRTLRVLVAKRNYDLIVSGNDSAAAALIEARWLFRFRTPIVIWDFSPAIEWRVRLFTQNRTIPQVDGIIALNEIQRPHVAERWGAHVPVIVVGHWVDTDFYWPEPMGDTILAVGDDLGRDYPTLLSALEHLPERTIIRTSQPLKLSETKHRAVTIMRERITPVAFRGLYAASRFVVVPLKADTRNASGISTILEAAAMGRAVVVSDSDGIREFVRHDETGLVVPANDPAALRAAIEKLLLDPETSARLGREARRFVERTAAPAVFATRLAAAFRALTSPPPSPA
jgi:glycosyltransferase involved in cell wall biosynthesis